MAEAKSGVAAFEDVEGTARRMGWKPEAEFQGDKTKWKPAPEYLETALTNYPVLMDRYRILDSRFAKTEKELRGANAKLDDVGKAVGEMRDFQQAALTHATKAAYEQARADIKADIEQATKDADPAATRAALARLDELDAKRPPEKPAAGATSPPPPPAAAKPGIDGQPQPQIAPEVNAWVTANPWYNTDLELNAAAVFAHQRIALASPELSLADNLKAVTEDLKKRYPEKFPDEAGAAGEGGGDRRPAGGGEGGRGGAPVSESTAPDAPRRPSGTRGRAYADLPVDGKAAHDRFTKTMVKGKDGKLAPMMTSAQYLAQYPWEG